MNAKTKKMLLMAGASLGAYYLFTSSSAASGVSGLGDWRRRQWRQQQNQNGGGGYATPDTFDSYGGGYNSYGYPYGMGNPYPVSGGWGGGYGQPDTFGGGWGPYYNPVMNDQSSIQATNALYDVYSAGN